MAERFYSSIRGDEGVFMCYNAVQQQQVQQQQAPLPQQQLQLQLQQPQQQQQQSQSLTAVALGGIGPSAAEFDYLANRGYFVGAQLRYTDANGGADSYTNDNNNKLIPPPGGMLSKYMPLPVSLASLSSMAAGVASLATPLHEQHALQRYPQLHHHQQQHQHQPHATTYAQQQHAAHKQTQATLPQHQQHLAQSVASATAVAAAAAAGGGGGCHYAHANGAGACYTRNRYMPYNHSRACAAAAAAALAYPFQQFAPIYRGCGTGAAAVIAPSGSPCLTATVSAVSGSISSASSSSFERHMTTAASTTTSTAELSYTNAVAATLSGATAAIGSAGQTSKFASSSMSGGGGSVGGGASVTSCSSSTSSIVTSTPFNSSFALATCSDPSQTVTLQITNLDYSMDEASLRNFLLNQLKPITPVVSLVFEGSSYAKVTVPDLYFAKQVVSNLHRKKIGHKRMLVSYTRDSSLTEINTLRCQVAGLLKDVPYYTLPMYKFRELFQSRFKTSISVLDLYKMPDICTINADNNEEKFICLNPELVNTLENSPLIEGLQHSVPYCTIHFKREQHKGWAEQEIEPLPNVFMTIAEVQRIIYPLLKGHPGDIPVASLVHCIEAACVPIAPNEAGVNLEHLVCCVQGIQIQMNNFGIKILGWLELDKEHSASGGGSGSGSSGGSGGNGGGSGSGSAERSLYAKSSIADPLTQISREVIELVKMSPKATMKFNRFIPAYHNHFGKQCRVADYGYTKLIELFEALSSVVQIMGDGENRQITLTHRTQVRRFTSDLLRVLRAHGNNKSVLLSQLPTIFAQTQNRNFDVTDYGVCDLVDILEGLVNSNIVVVATVHDGKDILISIPKRRQTAAELEKTCTFAGEMVELFRMAPQYAILFQKFVRSYHYHFAYQCRLSDYGYLKLADLMDAIHGIVEMTPTNDEDKKIYLSPAVARRVFAEQCEELIRAVSGASRTCTKLDDVLRLHKKKFGYQIQPHTLGVKDIAEAIELLPYVEVLQKDDCTWIQCHNENVIFRNQCYRAVKYLLVRASDACNLSNSQDETGSESLDCSTTALEERRVWSLAEFVCDFNAKQNESITIGTAKAMKHAIEIYRENGVECVRITKFMRFIMHIVRLLEQRPTMLFYEIKSAMECNISTTFEFGYATLFSLLIAYPDIFSVNLGASQDRSEVSLLSSCKLRLTQPQRLPLYGSLKLPYAKQSKTTTRPPRQPLAEHNGCGNSGSITQQGPPPAKTRAMCSDHHNNNNSANKTHILNNSNSNSNNNSSNYYQQQFVKPLQNAAAAAAAAGFNVKPNATFSHGGGSGGGGDLSIYASASLQSSMLNTSSLNLSGSNKENSFNASLNLFNSSFNSSSNHNNNNNNNNTSFVDLNQSVGGMMPRAQSLQSTSSTRLWDRRHHSTTYYQQHQQQQQHVRQEQMGGLPPLIAPPPSIHHSLQTQTAPAYSEPPAAGLYELVNNIQMYPMYEPPKPDTPPSDNMPFWIDPIWTNANNAAEPPKNELLNIKLPEMKAFNFLPMVQSPYTLSKNENMKQQFFNFDSHDRKIA